MLYVVSFVLATATCGFGVGTISYPTSFLQEDKTAMINRYLSLITLLFYTKIWNF